MSSSPIHNPFTGEAGTVYSENGQTWYITDGQEPRLADAQEAAAFDAFLAAQRDTLASVAAQEADVIRLAAEDTARDALVDAVSLAALSPHPTPEEQAIVDAQVASALGLFRALEDPPTDVTALAAAVLSLEV